MTCLPLKLELTETGHSFRRLTRVLPSYKAKWGEGSGRMGMEGYPRGALKSVLRCSHHTTWRSWGERWSAVTPAPRGDWLLSVPQHPAQYVSRLGPGPPLYLVSSSPFGKQE